MQFDLSFFFSDNILNI